MERSGVSGIEKEAAQPTDREGERERERERDRIDRDLEAWKSVSSQPPTATNLWSNVFRPKSSTDLTRLSRDFADPVLDGQTTCPFLSLALSLSAFQDFVL